MDNVDDYVTGHEDEIEQFNFEGFKKDLYEWHNFIKDDLRENKYDMNLLCINAVLDNV